MPAAAEDECISLGQGVTITRRTAPLPRQRDAAHGSRGPGLSFAARRWDAYDRDNRIAEWDALAQWASEPNPFYESWYLLPSLELLDGGRDVELLELRADRQLVGLLPVRRERDYYGHPLPHIRNWVHPNCFLGHPLVAPGFERMFWREAIAWADRHAGLSLFLHLSHMPMGGIMHSALRDVCGETARPAATVMREERALLQSDLSADEYLAASLSAKKRKELRRQHRRLGEEGELEFERCNDAAGLDRWIAEFLQLEAAGWKGEAGSALASDDATRGLFSRALSGAARRGRLERLAIRLDGRAIAMLANFIAAPGAFSFKTAFDEDFARFSPGVLLQRENLEILARTGIAWVDSCAVEGHPMIDHIWRERRAIGRHSIGIGGAARRTIFNSIAKRETGAKPGGIA